MKKTLVITLFFLMVIALTTVAAESVSVYTTFEEPLAQELFDAFEAETGIKVEWVRLSTGEAVARLEAEANNPQVSAWVGGVGLGHIEAKEQGLTMP